MPIVGLTLGLPFKRKSTENRQKLIEKRRKGRNKKST
jgi:hypothetical protein